MMLCCVLGHWLLLFCFSCYFFFAFLKPRGHVPVLVQFMGQTVGPAVCGMCGINYKNHSTTVRGTCVLTAKLIKRCPGCPRWKENSSVQSRLKEFATGDCVCVCFFPLPFYLPLISSATFYHPEEGREEPFVYTNVPGKCLQQIFSPVLRTLKNGQRGPGGWFFKRAANGMGMEWMLRRIISLSTASQVILDTVLGGAFFC